MTTARNHKIVVLMSEYYDDIDQIHALKASAALKKKKILSLASNGRYGKFKLGEVDEKEIQVRAHTRKAYRYIRRMK